MHTQKLNSGLEIFYLILLVQNENKHQLKNIDFMLSTKSFFVKKLKFCFTK